MTQLIASAVMVAPVYLGPGLIAPNSQVANMPPELLMMKAIAIAVAFVVCGAALLDDQAEIVGASE